MSSSDLPCSLVLLWFSINVFAQDNEKASPSNVHRAMSHLRSTSQCTCIMQLATWFRWACLSHRQYKWLHSMTDSQWNLSAVGGLSRNGAFAYGPSSGCNGVSGAERRGRLGPLILSSRIRPRWTSETWVWTQFGSGFDSNLVPFLIPKWFQNQEPIWVPKSGTTFWP